MLQRALARDRAGEGDHPALRGRVDGVGLRPEPTGLGGDVDDAAVFRRCIAGSAAWVHAKTPSRLIARPAPALDRQIREEREVVDAGVVDQHVERAGVRDHARDGRRVGDVERHGTRAARADRCADTRAARAGRRAYCRGEPARGLAVEIGDHHLGALGGEPRRDRSADAARPAGHEGLPSAEPHRPVNRGVRRSMTAAKPSRASAVPESSETVRASSGKHASTEAPSPAQRSRFVAPSASYRASQ
jgi:hypothetical protein